jgi:L-threonylcarbamoyladenylate synthase
MGMAERIALDPPHVFWTLAREFWPGPFTLVIRARPLFPGEMLGPNDSLAVRIPDHLWLRQLVKKAGFPITATSANISGAKEISRPEEIIEIFKDKLGLIVDGGETPGGLPSTIIDLTCDKPRLIREGAVPSRLFIPYL